jgi:hypothetical protein
LTAACSSASPAASDSAESAPTESEGGEAASTAPSEEAYLIQQTIPLALQVTSTSIKPTGALHKDYTCEGEDYSPQLGWTGVPDDAQSIAIVAQDLDADEGIFAHWVLWGVAPDVEEIAANAGPSAALPTGTVEGSNGFELVGWKGPCPPPRFLGYGSTVTDKNRGTNRHHHNFNVYALDFAPTLGPETTRNDLLRAIDGHIVAAGDVTATYISSIVIRGAGN